ncbi:unnamed protein product [Mucor fragilis]
MKGILASVCALALLGIANATFPNDLFFHHHPDLVLNKNQIVNKNSQPQDHSRGGRGHYRQSYPPPSRNAYHGNPGRNAYHNGGGAPPNRANYNRNGNRNGNRNRYEPRSAAPVQKLSYNKDGSIKWANKLAASYDQQQGQEQQQDQGQQDYGQYYDQDQQQQQQSSDQSQGQKYNDYYGGNDDYYGGNNNNNNNGYYDESDKQQQGGYYGPNSQQQNDHYGSSEPYTGGNQGSNYYQDDQQQSPNPYYGQGNGNYRGDQNNYYGGNNDYGYSNGNNYGNNNYGGTNNNNYGYGGNNNNNNNQDQDQDQDQDQTSNSNQGAKQNVTAGFAGGIRLAGALPDDGYNRGQGTFYDLETRVGSCGKQNKNSELVAAVNSEQMGGDSGRSNPNCGKDIEVVGPSGKTIQVTVVDNCKTCQSGGLDLSPAAFEEIGDFSHGSVPIKWKFV